LGDYGPNGAKRWRGAADKAGSGGTLGLRPSVFAVSQNFTGSLAMLAAIRAVGEYQIISAGA